MIELEIEGEEGGDGAAEADEEALEGVASGFLFFGEGVGDEGAEGLHGGVDGAVENP